MRTLFTKLSALAVVTLLVTGCTGSNGTAVPIANGALGSGGQPGNPLPGTTNPVGTGGLGTPQANTIAPVSLDNGPLVVAGDSATGGKASGFFGASTFAGDVAGPESLPTVDAGTPARPTNTPSSGSHTIVFTTPTASQVIVRDTLNAAPPLFYNYGASVGILNLIGYGTLNVHAALATSAGAAAPAGTTISAEIVGGAGTTAYDIRVPCTGTIPVSITAAASLLTCALPAYGTLQTTATGGFVLPGTANVQIPTAAPFPNAVSPSAVGNYVPNAGYALYFVVNFPTGSFATGTASSYALSLDNVYVTQ